MGEEARRSQNGRKVDSSRNGLHAILAYIHTYIAVGLLNAQQEKENISESVQQLVEVS